VNPISGDTPFAVMVETFGGGNTTCSGPPTVATLAPMGLIGGAAGLTLNRGSSGSDPVHLYVDDI
jgi:hypothetical protein